MNTQPTALRLADALTELDAQFSHPGICGEAAAELRRLHQNEREGWRYADELEQERKRLHEVNQELLEALQTIMGDGDHGQSMTWTERCQQARAAILKATGEQA